MRLIFFLLMAFLYAFPLSAATPSEPSYRLVHGQAGYPWSEGLQIFLETDTELCKEKYGQKWRQKCVSAPGRPGLAAKGIVMQPSANGYWEWSDINSLRFVPADGHTLQPDTIYEVDLSTLYLPPSVKLNKNKVRIHTKPLSVRLLNMDFFINPSPEGKHRLSCAVEFNYPVAHEPEIKILSEESISIGKADKVWNGERDHLNISWPVNKLPQNPGQCSILFPGMGQILLENGNFKYFPPLEDKKGMIFTKNLPAANELFFIKSASLESKPDSSLDSGYILKLESSLYARAEDLLEHLLVYELPRYRSDEAKEPCDWRLAPALSPDILKKSIRLDAVSANKSGFPQASMEFKIPVKQGAYVLFVLDDKFKSASGLKLSKPWLSILHAEPITSEVGFLQPGNVLSMRNGSKLELFGRELDAITWEAQLLRDPFLALLASTSWNPFTSPFGSLDTEFSSFSASRSGEIRLAREGQGKGQFASLDLGAIMPDLLSASANERGGGLVLVNLVGKKKGQDVAFASRLVLLSDLGLIVKHHANGKLQAFVRDLAQGRAVANLDIQVLGANGLVVASAKTDDQGQALLPSLSGLIKEAAPVAITASDSSQFTWLSLKDGSRELNYSNFNTGGSHIGPDDLNIYIFSQRDLYRPGEKMYFGYLARKGNLDLLPADLPLYAEIWDPRGLMVWNKTFNVKHPGMGELSWDLPEEALSGRYVLNIRTSKKGPVLQSKSCRVEQFQPESLKLKVSPPLAEGWLEIKEGGEPLQVDFTLQNLYGTPAAAHKVKASLELVPAQFHFKGFENYIFNDARPGVRSQLRRQLPEMRTDNAGKSSIKLPSDLLGQSSALSIISAEGFNAGGGRAVRAQASILSSPMAYIMGHRPKGDLTNYNYIPLNARAGVHFIALNPELKKISLEDLDFCLYRSRLVTSLLSDGNGGFKYDESPLEELVRQWRGSCPDDGLDMNLDTSLAGDFVLKVKDKKGKILSSISYSVIAESLALPNTQLQPAKMRMRLNTSSCKPGENVELALSLPYDGFGLITLEREGVEAWQWFEARAGESIQKFTIPDNFEGKAYMVVNFIRNEGSPRIYISPLSYAVESIMIEPAKRNMGLKLDVPEMLRPGENIKIKISAQQKGKAILFAVDEGILQLGAYQTPNPLKALLGDRALDVKTLQALDLLMPVQGLEKRLSAFGGGMDGSDFGSRFQNPFKRKNEPPLTAWFADLDVDAEAREINLPVPAYYNGQIRIMAVGISEEGTGSVARQCIVRAPFIISPQLPLFVSPKDSFKGGLLLSNNGDSDGEWEVSISDSSVFKIIKKDAERVSLRKMEEELWSFELEAPEKPGNWELRFQARKGEDIVERTFNLVIRPSSLFVTRIQAGCFTSEDSLPMPPDMFAERASSVATISTLPLALAQGLGHYLDDYPYGCTEQLLSRSFASLLLKPWLGKSNTEDQKLLEACLGAMRSRFGSRGLSLWPGSEGSLLLSAYGADFLLHLRQNASVEVDDLLNMLCDSLAENCSLNESSLDAARASAYAIWVLTREGRITTQLLEELLQSLTERQVEGWENDLTALLIAASQKELQFPKTLPVNNIQYEPSDFFDEFSQYALHMSLLNRYFPELLDNGKKREFYAECVAVLNQNKFATFSAAQAIRALSSLGKDTDKDLSKLRIYCQGREGDVHEWANGKALSMKMDYCPKYIVEGDKEGLFWQVSSSGFMRKPNMKPEARGIVIEKEFLDRDGNSIDKASIGQEVHVRIRARSELGPIKDCVIADLLPGGLEMLFEKSENDSLPDAIKFLDRQEDRLLIFADLDSNPLEFVWKTRAATEGSFNIAPSFVEAMYNRYLSGQSASGVLAIGNE